MAKKRKKAKSKKQPSRKKAPRKKKPSDSMKVVSTSGIAFRKLPERNSKYRALFDKILKLKVGQSLVLHVPKGTTFQTYQNRLSSALSKAQLKAPKGCSFHKRTTENGKVAICCEKD